MSDLVNLDWLRTVTPKDAPDLGARLYETISALNQKHETLAQQVNGNGKGQPAAPPGIAGLTVSAQNGHFTASISDNSQIYRGVNYWLEHSDSPHFINPIVEDLGQSRNWHDFLGNTTRYFRAYSSYASTPPGPPAYHGSQVAPLPVAGGGTAGPPAWLASQGSGTGAPGQGLTGPGIIPFRSANGKPPVR
jgi:hypothetical protein